MSGLSSMIIVGPASLPRKYNLIRVFILHASVHQFGECYTCITVAIFCDVIIKIGSITIDFGKSSIIPYNITVK